MRQLTSFVTALALIMSLCCPGFAQSYQSNMSIWNGTTVPLKFSLDTAGRTYPTVLAPSSTFLVPCEGFAHLSIKTGESVYQTEVPCEGAYGLYYDERDQRFGVRSIAAPNLTQKEYTNLPLRLLWSSRAPFSSCSRIRNFTQRQIAQLPGQTPPARCNLNELFRLEWSQASSQLRDLTGELAPGQPGAHRGIQPRCHVKVVLT